ncbi:hypothetical protein A2U01_0077444, partial [Trifolium medium]|nr:hypothetical protein [Trifolium medium]
LPTRHMEAAGLPVQSLNKSGQTDRDQGMSIPSWPSQTIMWLSRRLPTISNL